MRKLIVGLAAAAGLFVAAPALAAPVIWTVPATVLPDGATISGTFVYDTATSTISNVNITQTAVRPGTYTFTTNFPTPYRGGQRTASAAPGDETWFLTVAGIPANGGAYNTGTIGTGNCNTAPGGICDNAGVSNIRSNVAITGVPAAAAVPTLSEWAMILMGLTLAGGAALFLQRRRFTA